jgi:uncharacterized RDD family membrane protein YckC
METGAQPAQSASPAADSSYLSRRCGALLIDGVIALCLFLVVGFGAQILRRVGVWHPTPMDPVEAWHALDPTAKVLIMLSYALSTGFVYVALCESSAWQGTIGKRRMRLFVTDTMGARISTGRSIVRSLVRVLHYAFPPLPFILSAITVGVTAKHKAVHDYVAGTVVVPGRAPKRIESWRLLSALLGQIALNTVVSFVVVYLTEQAWLTR